MTVSKDFPRSQVDPGVHMVAPPPVEDCTVLDDGRWHFCPENSRDAHHGCVDLHVTPDSIRVTATWPAPGVATPTPRNPRAEAVRFLAHRIAIRDQVPTSGRVDPETLAATLLQGLIARGWTQPTTTEGTR